MLRSLTLNLLARYAFFTVFPSYIIYPNGFISKDGQVIKDYYIGYDAKRMRSILKFNYTLDKALMLCYNIIRNRRYHNEQI